MMDEFCLIDHFFKKQALSRDEVVYGIGDDAACVNVPSNQQLLITTDTLVAGVHFLADWDPYDIAYKAVMVNVSDIAAMAAKPCWASLALSLPKMDSAWLKGFSQGLHEALQKYAIALIGGDTTRGPLTITLTMHGLAPSGKALRRNGAKLGDKIFVSGELGAAAMAVSWLPSHEKELSKDEQQTLSRKLKHPFARVDLSDILQQYAQAAIDISDGLSADLYHICDASGVGACLSLTALPIHSLVAKYQSENALSFVLGGGDDYELCFTVSPKREKDFLLALAKANLTCYPIGEIESKKGLRMMTGQGRIVSLPPQGYRHF